MKKSFDELDWDALRAKFPREYDKFKETLAFKWLNDVYFDDFFFRWRNSGVSLAELASAVMVEINAQRTATLPSPTDKDLESPIFNAIFDCIKTWDVNVPERYHGYCGANGSHAKIIYDAVLATKPVDPPKKVNKFAPKKAKVANAT